MKKRWYFIPAFAIVFLLFIIGTFLDLNFSQSIYHPWNGFSKFVAGFSPVLVSFFIAFMAGSVFKKYLDKKEDKPFVRFLFMSASICMFICGAFFCCIELSSYHSYNIRFIFAFLITAALSIPFFFVGIKCIKRIDNPNLIKIFILIIIVFGLNALIIQVSKILVPRIRYTSLVHFDHLDWYRPWYNPSISGEIIETCKSWLYEEAKSFPSGHANTAVTLMFMLYFLTYLDKKRFEKYSAIIFFSGFIFFLLVSFSRILSGSHYLTDTMFGGFVGLSLFFIANEIYLRKLDISLKE